ncbi:bifunctional helix-turn-helix transcriptional regulator/GNAT family N-acetyltransferase [Paenibacillus sp. YN15]|uniref:bifunctional helix-turn-helix transcriptional regulator/GNAT family N-acetyltransferase n=1 Tax=Paenibacillus sp. YN15 TaxID=1742774 RepID=UPI000DCD3684|nr:bifunctional helix-turn-helix transcriptional regulator/GNAT family N-acetyltransferase [Paenibacillus sp. YN15]RAU94346.1 MarR family transcriptional regulator [Paenibacillus sp. YN15]
MNYANTLVHVIRKFNRFYTNILGLLEQHLPDSDFSLSEARVLYEIGHVEECTARMLIDRLRMDAGYLSRILKRLEKLELTYRVQSTEDGRLYYLYLTDAGTSTLSKLDTLSNQQIGRLVGHLKDFHSKRLAGSMTAIEQILSDQSGDVRQSIQIRNELRPGDAGTLIHLHGWIYAQECGYNHDFEGYVCKTFHDFFESYRPEKDRFWFAEAGGEMIGAIAIVGHSADRAQLRWFILHPDFRGLGLGKKLLNQALDYCREKGYRHIFLETTDDQKTAIGMYESVGFGKTGEQANQAWGVRHVEQLYELELPE